MTHPIITNNDSSSTSGFTNAVIIPTIEELDDAEKRRQDAENSLETSDGHAKCQSCNTAVPIGEKFPRSHSDRIVVLEKKISWAENHNDDINLHKTLKAELADLLREEEKRDKVRSLPLYSSS
jgi:hypothetical protein